MKTIELPKWVAVVIVLLIVFVVAKIFFDKFRAEYLANREKLQQQLLAIKETIARQSEKLNQLTDKKAMLGKLVVIRWRIVKAIFGAAVLIIFMTSCYITQDIITSLSSTATIVLIPLGFLIFLFSDETKDTNGLIQYLRMKIQLSVYQKNGFNPLEMESLERDIANKKEEAKKIKNELEILNAQCG